MYENLLVFFGLKLYDTDEYCNEDPKDLKLRDELEWLK